MAQIDPHEDSQLRTSNVLTRGPLPTRRGHLQLHTANINITLVKWPETPQPRHSHLLHGGKGGSKLKPINITPANAAATGSPYRTSSSSSQAVMSSPYPSVLPPMSHPPPPSPMYNRRLPPGLPILQTHSPDTASSSDVLGTETEGRQTPTDD